MKRIISATIVFTITLSTISPCAVYAEDITSPVGTIGESEAYDTNYSTIECLNGSLNTNEGYIESSGRNSIITTNNSGDDPDTEEIEYGIYESGSTLATNNGSIYCNYGYITENASGGYLFVNSAADVYSNHGVVYCGNGVIWTNEEDGRVDLVEANGVVVTNKGYVGELVQIQAARPHVTHNIEGAIVNINGGDVRDNSGTVNTNKRTGNVENVEDGVVDVNYGNVTDNEGTVNTNMSSGVVVNSDGGVVKINRGGTVNGVGTVEINLSNANRVADTVTVEQQMWRLYYGNMDSLSLTDRQENGKNNIYNDTLSGYVQVYLWDNGSVIVAPATGSRTIRNLSVDGGATVTKLDNGTFIISGITRDVNLSVFFEGDSEPQSEESDHSDDEVSNPPLSTDAPTETPSETLTNLPSANIAELAPILSPSTPFAAVDRSGNPIAIVINRTNGGGLLKNLYRNFISRVLNLLGVPVKNTHSEYIGTINVAAEGSIVTMRYRVSSSKMKSSLYVSFKDSLTGMMTYVVPQINDDGTISFEVPFANCEFSIISADK